MQGTLFNMEMYVGIKPRTKEEFNRVFPVEHQHVSDCLKRMVNSGKILFKDGIYAIKEVSNG